MYFGRCDKGQASSFSRSDFDVFGTDRQPSSMLISALAIRLAASREKANGLATYIPKEPLNLLDYGCFRLTG
jgi:hypothetical protein